MILERDGLLNRCYPGFIDQQQVFFTLTLVRCSRVSEHTMMQQHTGIKQFSGSVIQSKFKNQADKTLDNITISVQAFLRYWMTISLSF